MRVCGGSVVLIGVLLLFTVVVLTLPAMAMSVHAGGSECYVAIKVKQIRYKETASDKALHSVTTAHSLSGCIGYKRSWRYFSVAGEVSLPMVSDEQTETWRQNQVVVQTNDFKFREWGVRGDAGFAISRLLHPYFGVEWSDTRQRRRDFIIPGRFLSSQAEEKIEAWNALLGIRGLLNPNPDWWVGYDTCFRLPLQATVTNTGVPGWKVRSHKGYGFHLQGTVGYAVSPQTSIRFICGGGKMYWAGSDYRDGWKWPENETIDLSAQLGIGYVF